MVSGTWLQSTRGLRYKVRMLRYMATEYSWSPVHGTHAPVHFYMPSLRMTMGYETIVHLWKEAATTHAAEKITLFFKVH